MEGRRARRAACEINWETEGSAAVRVLLIDAGTIEVEDGGGLVGSSSIVKGRPANARGAEIRPRRDSKFEKNLWN